MTRSQSPFNFNSQSIKYLKHLSIIAFNKKSLKNYSSLKMSKYYHIVAVELLMALVNEMLLGSFSIKSYSFSVDILEDFIKAKKFFIKYKIKLNYSK